MKGYLNIRIMFKLHFVFPLQKVLNVIFKAFFLKTETFDDLKFNFKISTQNFTY